MHHAFVIEAEAKQGVERAKEWLAEKLGMQIESNPDILVLEYGLLSVEDARKVAEAASGAPFRGDYKAVIISASRAYHEAQNALLKIFEEPPPGTYLFLILPSLGGLLPTLRSRVQELDVHGQKGLHKVSLPDMAQEFLKGVKEKRSALVKKLTSGKDDDARRENREEAIALINGVEATLLRQGLEKNAAALSDIAVLRGHLHDRSAPVKLILEHLSLVIPKISI
jgi:hypothetical protein